MENKKQPIELADIFRDCGDDFLKTHNLCADQVKAFYAIENCRTAGAASAVSPDNRITRAATGIAQSASSPKNCNGWTNWLPTCHR
jgi:hypothetical protein